MLNRPILFAFLIVALTSGAPSVPVSAGDLQLAGATNRSTSTGSRVSPPPRPVLPPRPAYGEPPVQAPSVDNNPIGNRGQSLYPPRATTDTGR